MSALLSRDEVLQALKVSGEGGVSNMRTPHVRLYEDKTKQKKRMEGFLQAPRVLRGIERWSKLWFVLYRDVSTFKPFSFLPFCWHLLDSYSFFFFSFLSFWRAIHNQTQNHLCVAFL